MVPKQLLPQIAALQRLIDASGNIVFFGGAGVSTESGLPDFRSADGLYRQKYRYPPETILSHSFFLNHPDEFYEFYRAKMLLLTAEPNAAHRTLAGLEAAGRLQAVVTQNIDGLHQKAGSRRVLELHGSVHRNFCLRCGAAFDAEYIQQSSGVPLCPCGGMIKPDVVLYEENLDPAVIDESVRLISRADVLIVGGTSLAVYPAAGLVDYFRGRHLVVINQEANQLDDDAGLVLKGSIGQILEQIRIH